jgi:uncharacterized protein (DUF4415 family)
MNDEFQATWPEQGSTSSDSGAPAVRASSNQQLKQIVTIRLDVDMLNWFKSAGPGYQTRINQILRDHMDEQRAARAAAE